MICTSIEQSKELARLLDPKTADMCWGERQDGDNVYYSLEAANLSLCDDSYIPAWSLSALLEVMPRNPSITYHLFSSMMPHEKDVNTTNGWICDRTEFIKVDEGTFHEGTKRLYECFKGEDPITAAYEMVVWLLEQGYIKKGGQDGGYNKD